MYSNKKKSKNSSKSLYSSEQDANTYLDSEEPGSDTCDEYYDDDCIDGVSSGFIYYDETDFHSKDNSPRIARQSAYTMIKPPRKMFKMYSEKFLDECGFDDFNENAWNLIEQPKKKDLKGMLVHMVQHFEYTNCDLLIDEVIFRCHHLVLKCYSNFFIDKAADIVILSRKYVPPDIFALIYDWMLQVKPIIPRHNIMGTFTAAKYLQMNGLIEQCWACLDNCDLFYEKTAFDLYLEAKFFNQQLVQELMSTRINQYFLTLVASHDFLYLTSFELCEILRSNALGVNSEAEVFMAGIRWLNFKWEFRKRYVVDVMKYVRFGLMPPWYIVILQRHLNTKEIKRVIEIKEVERLINDGYSYGTAVLYYNNDLSKCAQMLAKFNLIEPPPRYWICDENCSYHHRMDCCKKIGVTYELFTDYLKFIRAAGRSYWETYKTKRDDSIVCCTGNSPNITDIIFGNLSVSKLDRRISSQGVKNKKFMVLPFRKQLEMDRESRISNMTKTTSNTNLSTSTNSGNCPSECSSKTSIINLSPKTNESVECRSSPGIYSSSDTSGSKKTATRDLHKRLLTPTKHFEGDKIFIFGASTSSHRESKSIAEANVYYYDVYNNEWIPLFKMGTQRYHSSAAVYKRKIYIVGGTVKNDENAEKTVSSEVWSFDPIGLQWNNELSLPSARKDFATVSHKSGLYVIGGQTVDGVVISTILCYNRNTKKWLEKSPMIFARIGLSAAVVKDEIWVAGGMIDKKNGIPILSDTIEAYNIKSDSWSLVAKLHTSISYGKLCVSDKNEIYYTGGLTFNANEKFNSLKTIVKYNPENKSWETVATMTNSRHGHEALIVLGKCFIFGGIVENQPTSYAHVDCLCLQTNKWIDGVASLPVELFGLAAVRFS